MAQTSLAAAKTNGKPVTASPPAAVGAQLSYSGTPRGSDGTTTPDDYTREMADPVRRMQIFEEMRASDSAVAGAIDARRQEINAANWVLSSEDKSDRGKEILEFVEDNVYPVLDDIIRWVAGGGIHYGFGCVEPVYAWRDAPRAGIVARGKVRRPTRSTMRGIYLEKIAHLRQPSIETFKISEQGDLQTVVQHAFNGSSYRRVEIPAEKALIWTYDRQGDDRWGVPPTRHCYKAWAFKQQIEKLNILHTDRFAVGLPIVEEGEGWTARERTALAAFMRTLRASGENFLMVPNGGKITIATDNGETSMSMLEWLKYYDLCIAKTYLTQQSELGSTETGSRAVGDTMVEQLGGLVQADCEDLAAILNGDLLVKRQVDLNFGPQKHYPQFAPSQRVKASGALATMARPLIDAGLLKARPGDEIVVRDSIGLPPIAEGEETQEATPPAVSSDAPSDAPTDPAAVPAPPAAGADGAGGGDEQRIQVTEQAVLNGAQISSAKDIIIAVAAGQLPRDTGVAMLQVFFNLTPQKAEEIMGSAGTKTPTTPNPIAGSGGSAGGAANPEPAPAAASGDVVPPGSAPAKKPALAASRQHTHARQLTLAEGAPTPAVPGTSSYRTPELTQWEQRILRPDVLVRDLDLATSRLAGEVQDVLAAMDADLEAQATALAKQGAAALSAAVRDIAVPEKLRKQLRTVLYEAAQRSRDYGAKAVRNEITRQLAPDGIGPQRDSWWPSTMEAPPFYSRALLHIRALVAGAPDTTPRDLHLVAEVDRAVEEEVQRRESSIRSGILTSLAQAAGAAADKLAEIVSTAAAAALIGLSTGRTQSNVEGVVKVGFGVGRSDAAESIAQPAGEVPGGGARSGLRDSEGNDVGLVAKIYSATMELGTCDECAKWDGAEFPIDHPEDYTGVQCPNPRCAGGIQCNCVWIYITSRESVPLVPAAKGPE